MFVFSGLDKTSKTPANQGRVVEPTKPTQLPDIDEHAEREPSRMATLPSRSSHASESLETAFIFHSTNPLQSDIAPPNLKFCTRIV
ncbi:hypothetical protein [Mesorhizobium helmanticense]|uniref:hypothetical protein n=1 Tax=Mesorhizobium helmanticense TaxID=1776423 RepID=UPI0011B26C83|nr:hypothetical protein [Mesorhizobium helmanticense]